MTEPKVAACQDCGRQYGDEYGFPDLVIPYWAWTQISPTKDDGGLLCPSCICKRLYDAKLRCEGAFMSGPIISATQTEMSNLRRIENIELALEGRKNHWGTVLQDRARETPPWKEAPCSSDPSES